jgi:hypothetical protein
MKIGAHHGIVTLDMSTTLQPDQIAAFQKNLRFLATRGDRSNIVTIANPRSGDRHVTVTVVSGPRVTVEEHVGHLLASSRPPTLHYEHMALQIVGAVLNEDTLSVTLSESRYAGD